MNCHLSPRADRLRHLTTQLKWRLANGGGSATYIIGIDDDGTPSGIPPSQLRLSLAVLTRMAESLDATVQAPEHFLGTKPQTMIARVQVVQSLSQAPAKPEVRLALLGADASGKSTLCGVLTNGDMDDGEGQARYFVFRHEHEIDDGRTSSVSCQLVGFDAEGKLVNAAAEDIGGDVTPAEVVQRSAKLMLLLDLAGHHKYLKTTVVGMMGHLPDVALLVVDAAAGVQRMTREHLAIAMALGIPVAVLLNKIDLVPSGARDKVVDAVRSLFRASGSRHRMRLVQDAETAAETASLLGVPSRMSSAKDAPLVQQVPVFLCSQVTGEGLPLLVRFLSHLSPSRNNAHFQTLPESLQVVDCFDVAGVGTVAAGTVFSGRFEVGQQLVLGPDGLGAFRPVVVDSIHCNRMPVASVGAGQSGALALTAVDGKPLCRASVRKGMVLLHPDTAQHRTAAREFEATITVLRHGNPITPRTSFTVFSGSFKQSAQFVWMQKTKLQAGDVCTVRLRLQHRPEFLRVSQPVLLTARPAVAIGTVTRVGLPRTAIASDQLRGTVSRSGSFDVGNLQEMQPHGSARQSTTAPAAAAAGAGAHSGQGWTLGDTKGDSVSSPSVQHAAADTPSIISILADPSG